MANSIDKISASQFKAKCLALLDQVNTTGESLIVTKHGTPVARLVPARAGSGGSGSPIGCMQDTASEIGDITQPLDTAWSTYPDVFDDSA